MINNKTAIYCKSFRDDFERLKQLISSIEQHNPDNIPLLLSIPQDDRDLLESLVKIPSFVTVIEDESYVDQQKRFSHGWQQQQLCKLNVHKTGFANSYLMIDSDTYIISNINSDLYYTRDRPNIVYSYIFTKYDLNNAALKNYISSEDHLAPEVIKCGTQAFFRDRLSTIKKYADENAELNPMERGNFINVLFDSPGAATQPAQIFHVEILELLERFFCENGLDFYDAIALSPWEYNWYGHFAATLEKDVFGIVSPILHFANDAAIADAKESGFEIEQFQRKFVGIQMAARHFETTVF